MKTKQNTKRLKNGKTGFEKVRKRLKRPEKI